MGKLAYAYCFSIHNKDHQSRTESVFIINLESVRKINTDEPTLEGFLVTHSENSSYLKGSRF